MAGRKGTGGPAQPASKRIKADAKDTPKVQPETKLSNSTASKTEQSSLSASDVASIFEKAVRGVKEEPLNSTRWEDLRKAARLQTRRCLPWAEKTLSEALRAAFQSEDFDQKQVSFAAWSELKELIGFRPKLVEISEIVAALPQLSSDFHVFILEEFQAVVQAEADRKAFEIICTNVPLLIALLRSLDEAETKVPAKKILAAAIFENDPEDEIVNACEGPRAKDYHLKEKKKARVQNNWRAVLWKALKEVLKRKGSVSSFAGLCAIHRQHRGKDHNVIFWFELLFASLECTNQPDVAIISGLLDEGLSCYEPTSDDDFKALGLFVERVIASQDIDSKSLVSIANAILQLDYRAMESNLAAYLTKCEQHKSNTCDLLLVYLNSFLATRRAHMWVELLSRLVDEKLFSDDLALQLSFTDQTSELLTVKLLDMYVPQVWRAFDDAFKNVGFDHVPILCAFDGFVASLTCERPPDELASDILKRVEQSCLERLRTMVASRPKTNKKRKVAQFEDQSLSHVLCSIRLLRTCALYMDLCGANRSFADIQEVLEAFRDQAPTLDTLILSEWTMTCASLNISLTSEASTENLMTLPFLRATKDVYQKMSTDDAASWWYRIVQDTSSIQVLSLAPVYEVKALREGLCVLLESSRDESLIEKLVTLICEFPKDYLGPDDVKRVVQVMDKKGKTLDASSVARMILAYPQSLKKLLGTKISSLTHFLERIENETLKSAMLHLYVQSAEDSKALKGIEELASKRDFVAIILSSLATRLESSSQDSADIIVEIGRKCLRESQKLEASSDKSLEVAGAQLNLGCALKRATSDKSPMPVAIDFCLLLRQTCEQSDSASVLAFLEAASRNFANLEDNGPQMFALLLSRVLAIQSTESSALALTKLMESASTMTPEFVGLAIESLLNCAWLCRVDDVPRVALQIKALLEARLAKSGRGNVVRRAKAIAGAIGVLISRAPFEGAPLECILYLLSSKSLMENMEADDITAMLSALVQSRHILLVRVLQVIVEMNAKLVTDKCSGVFTRVLAVCERELIFSKTLLRTSDRIRVAMDLARTCESFKQHESAFKHVAVGILADHITLVHFEGLDHHDLKRALDLFAFTLLDLFGDREIQQLHAVLGGGAGGARREILKRLIKDYDKHYAFKGKV